MKIAVFSDAHGNLNALDKVLNSIKSQNVDKVIFLGDIFSKGENALDCLDRLINFDVTCLTGNCELYLICGVEIDCDVLKDKEYYDTERAKLNGEQLNFLKSLPLEMTVEFNKKKLHFAHFLISDPTAAYPFEQLSIMKNGQFERLIENNEYDLMVIGHTHKHFVWGNVVGVDSCGVNKPNYLLIEVGNEISFSVVEIDLKKFFNFFLKSA
ncbi:MAG: metallophosphoesterase family protein [Candidatus Coproplasma sp.]